MPNYPLVALHTLALAALLALPATAAAAASGHDASDAASAHRAGALIRVAQFQVLDTESGEREAAEEADVDVFTWQAQKDGSGIVFTGTVPSTATQSLIAVTTSGDVDDDTHIGTGAPDGFLIDALTGLDALAALEKGSLRYADGMWALQGQLAPGGRVDTLETILDLAATPREAWTLDIATQPEDDMQADTSGTASVPDRDEETTATASESVEDANSGEVIAPAGDEESADERTTAPSETDESTSIGEPDPEYRFSALKRFDGTLMVQGDVPDASTRALVMRLAGETGQGSLDVNPHAPQDFVSALYAGLAALNHLDQGQLAFANGNWLLTGRARIDTRKNEALATLARLGGAERFRTMVTAPSASSVCQAEVAAFMADKSILFNSGSANLTPASLALLPDIAQLLSICPQTTVYVEGHTDSDGGQALNLPLSVSRAEAVVDELIALGVSARRLYAVGYGASLPIASNDTAQGKRQNRRIAFTFEE
ncbi:OmpA family protein [Pelagibacterium halotolerans]|uniref:OmpA family protein n=1 Tax=Pelagibacterium halotolerans TaxID=531813 RepID=UPI00384BFDD0